MRAAIACAFLVVATACAAPALGQSASIDEVTIAGLGGGDGDGYYSDFEAVLFDSDPVVDDAGDNWERTTPYEQPKPDGRTADSSPNATIDSFELPNRTYAAGEIVNATVEITNTGETNHTFFVGYSVVGPNGTVYDNNGTTGATVTIPPDQNATVTVWWVVERDAPAGTYDAITAVWAESDIDEFETRLDDAKRESAFEVAADETDGNATVPG